MAALTPNDIVALNRRATELYRTGKPAEAAQASKVAYRAAIENLPPDDYLRLTVVQNVAGIHELAGDAETAIALYRELTQNDSEDNRLRRAYAHERLFEIHSARSEWAEAVTAGDASFEAWSARGDPIDETVVTFLDKLAFAHYSDGDLDGAARFGEMHVDGRRQVSGERSAESAVALRSLAIIRQAQGRGAAAEVLFRRALEISRGLRPEDHESILESLRSLAAFYSDSKSAEAVPLHEEIVARLRSMGATNTVAYARDLNNLATLYYLAGEVAKSRPLYEEALAISRATSGSSHRDTVDAEGNLANVLRELGDFDAAETLLRSGLAARLTLGDDDRTATTLGDLRELYEVRKSRASLASLYGEVFEMVLSSYESTGRMRAPLVDVLRRIERTDASMRGAADTSLIREAVQRSRPSSLALPKTRRRRMLYVAEVVFTIGDDIALAIDLFTDVRKRAENSDEAVWRRASAGLAAALSRAGRSAEAIAFCEETLAKVGDDDAQTVVPLLRTMAAALSDLGRADEAVETMRESVTFAERAFGVESAAYADALARLGELALQAHDLELAVRVAEQSSAIAERHGAALVAARAAKVLAAAASRRGEFREAEALYGRAYGTFAAAWGHDATQRAIVRDLAVAYANAGQHDTALPLIESALSAAGKSEASVHEILDLKLTKAQLKAALGSFAEAIELLTEVAGTARAAEDVRRTGQAYLATGVLYVELGADEEARGVLGHALELFHEDGEYGDVVSTLIPLAILESRGGNHDAALAMLGEAIRIAEERSPAIARALQEKAWILARVGRWDEAFATMTASADLIEEDVLRSLVIAGESRREALVQRLYHALDLLLTMAMKLQTADAIAGALERLLRWKGFALEWTAIHAAGLATATGTDTRVLREELSRTRSRIAELTLAGVSGDEVETLRERVKRLDTELSKHSAAAVSEVKARATITAVRDALREDAMLIEYARYESIDFVAPSRGTKLRPGEHRYAAFVLRRDEAPVLFDAGDAQTIEERIGRFRAWIIEEPLGPTAEEWVEIGNALRVALLDKAISGLAEGSTVRIAPDGDLARVPFAALPLDGGYLIDTFELSFVNNGREILYEQAPRTTASTPPLVIADPDFDLGIETASESAVRPFPPLDGTRAEGQAVARQLGVEPLTGAAAVEAALRTAVGPRVLHLATHGFFLTDDRPPPKEHVFERIEIINIPGGGQYLATATDIVRGLDEGPPVDRFHRIGRLANPLLRAGIALAGANTWASGGTLPAEAGDALLTAEEICAMDLRGTRLAVLSACESGLGEARSGEGVYGLRRAFAIAGVRTLVMSLWKIGDEETIELMVAFYDRLAEGEPCGRALRSAQIAVRRSIPDPLAWSGFVCVGDPYVRP